MDNEQKEKLISLCVEIFACCNNDTEITLHGNGTNSCEAANVARVILDILGMTEGDIQERIHNQ